MPHLHWINVAVCYRTIAMQSSCSDLSVSINVYFAFRISFRINRKNPRTSKQAKMSQPTEVKIQPSNDVDDNTNDNASHSSNKNQLKIIRMVRHSWKKNGRLKFLTTALCIFFAYFLVGVLQEKTMRGCYGDPVNKDCRNGERFKYAITLVAAQSLCAFLFIKSNCPIKPCSTWVPSDFIAFLLHSFHTVLDLIYPEEKDDTHFAYYIGGSFANAVAMIASNMALRFVSYPMQVIFKSAKPIAVMTFGIFICKRYTIQRYIFVVMIVVGVIVFKLFEGKAPKPPKITNSTLANSTLVNSTLTNATITTSPAPPTDTKIHLDAEWEQYVGIALLILSLSMDGVLGAVQDRIKAKYAPTFRQMMLSFAFWCFIITAIMVIVNREIIEVCEFAKRHPIILFHLLLMGLAAAIGQIFIYTMVSSFGSLACSVTTTVRKFFSVVFSIIFFQNPSTLIQWIGAVIVFTALLGDAIYGKGPPPKSKDSDTEKDTEMMEVSEKLLVDQQQQQQKPSENGPKSDADQNVV